MVQWGVAAFSVAIAGAHDFKKKKHECNGAPKLALTPLGRANASNDGERNSSTTAAAFNTTTYRGGRSLSTASAMRSTIGERVARLVCTFAAKNSIQYAGRTCFLNLRARRN